VTSLSNQQAASTASDGETGSTSHARVNGHHHLSASASEDSRAEEIELKQELGGVTRTPVPVSSALTRPRSPFHNGRTEKLIGPQDASPGASTPASDVTSNKVRTTAIVEITAGGGARSPVAPDSIRYVLSFLYNYNISIKILSQLSSQY
jgi:hypothetical protein